LDVHLFANYLLANLSFLLLLVVKSLEFYLNYFSWNCMVFRYSYDFLYRYYFLVSLDIAFTWCAIFYHAITCHLPDITLMSCYHLTSGMIYMTLIIIMIMGIMTWHLIYILIYSSTNCTL